jgi:hypothetical protein
MRARPPRAKPLRTTHQTESRGRGFRTPNRRIHAVRLDEPDRRGVSIELWTGGARGRAADVVAHLHGGVFGTTEIPRHHASGPPVERTVTDCVGAQPTTTVAPESSSREMRAVASPSRPPGVPGTPMVPGSAAAATSGGGASIVVAALVEARLPAAPGLSRRLRLRLAPGRCPFRFLRSSGLASARTLIRRAGEWLRRRCPT